MSVGEPDENAFKRVDRLRREDHRRTWDERVIPAIREKAGGDNSPVSAKVSLKMLGERLDTIERDIVSLTSAVHCLTDGLRGVRFACVLLEILVAAVLLFALNG